MSYIQAIQSLLKNKLNFENVSVGKVDAKNDVILLRITGGKGFNYCKTFYNKNMYQLKFQVVLYIKDLYKAYELAEKIEEILEDIRDEAIEDKEIWYFEKISGPIDLNFDEKDRKVISLNYIVNFKI